MLHLFTILSFWLALQLEQARTSPITVGQVARSTFIVRRMRVEKIRGPFAFGREGLLHVFQLFTSALSRVRVAFRRRPSRTLRSRGLPLQMLAQLLLHLRVILSLHGKLHVRHSAEVTQNSCDFLKPVLLVYSNSCNLKLSKPLTFVPLSGCCFSLLVLHSLDPACSALLVLCAVYALIYTARTQTLHLHKHQAVLISIVVVQHGVPCLPELSLPASRA